MLILSRKIGEGIILDGDIEVKVLSVIGDNVKIGIQAPSDVKVLRAEIYNDIKQQNLNSLNSNIDLSKLKNIGSLIKKK